ncbi:MAG: hypothetical protein JOZ00_01780 [Mycobacterium sp.]|uniref:hypothetical protein n=1 Tax=Mycobacterium sp. TaxID=1785 RepID=UPI001EBF3D71|nr:hypothetical protein [Mycobacterium sp.]MBV8785402.1 hypothetical protein [Mycobacterium sp.]
MKEFAERFAEISRAYLAVNPDRAAGNRHLAKSLVRQQITAHGQHMVITAPTTPTRNAQNKLQNFVIMLIEFAILITHSWMRRYDTGIMRQIPRVKSGAGRA